MHIYKNYFLLLVAITVSQATFCSTVPGERAIRLDAFSGERNIVKFVNSIQDAAEFDVWIDAMKQQYKKEYGAVGQMSCQYKQSESGRVTTCFFKSDRAPQWTLHGLLGASYDQAEKSAENLRKHFEAMKASC